jgi:hypothetical protein
MMNITAKKGARIRADSSSIHMMAKARLKAGGKVINLTLAMNGKNKTAT